MLFDICNLNFQLNSYIVPVIDMQPLLSLTMTKTNKKRPQNQTLTTKKTKQNNPAADYIIFGLYVLLFCLDMFYILISRYLCVWVCCYQFSTNKL